MLQQDKPEDFANAAGNQFSASDFFNAAAKELWMSITWRRQGVDKVSLLNKKDDEDDASNKGVDTDIIKVDSHYFSPTEVETLLGGPRKAQAKSSWTPLTSFDELVAEMIREKPEVG
jgi:GDPmannose 4,6-dehydratase